jgi:hypothetical protein
MRQGTVMIELVVATVLIGITTVALFEALIYSQHVSIRANRLARASQIANQEMEIVRATAYASLTVPYNGAFIGTTDSVSELPSGTSNLTISYQDAPTNSVKQAVITVTWRERTKTETVRYTTYVVNNGLYQ